MKPEQIEAFMKDLTELSKKHGIEIVGQPGLFPLVKNETGPDFEYVYYKGKFEFMEWRDAANEWPCSSTLWVDKK